MSAIIVAGSRRWTNVAKIRERIWKYPPFTIVLHGDSEGADTIAGQIAGPNAIAVPFFGWMGARGGPERNKAMLLMLLTWKKRGHDIAVEAFPMPDSKGTRHMIQIAREAGVPVHVTEGADQKSLFQEPSK